MFRKRKPAAGLAAASRARSPSSTVAAASTAVDPPGTPDVTDGQTPTATTHTDAVASPTATSPSPAPSPATAAVPQPRRSPTADGPAAPNKRKHRNDAEDGHDTTPAAAAAAADDDDHDDDGADDVASPLDSPEAARVLKRSYEQRQRLRGRHGRGTPVEALAAAAAASAAAAVTAAVHAKEAAASDAGRITASGLFDPKAFNSQRHETERIGSEFATESKWKDTTKHMNAFIEAQLAAHRQQNRDRSADAAAAAPAAAPAPAGSKSLFTTHELFEIPEHLQVKKRAPVEGNLALSQSMLTIPEIPLGMEERMRNIQRTCEAHQKLPENYRPAAPLPSRVAAALSAVTKGGKGGKGGHGAAAALAGQIVTNPEIDPAMPLPVNTQWYRVRVPRSAHGAAGPSSGPASTAGGGIDSRHGSASAHRSANVSNDEKVAAGFRKRMRR
ncbi:hypothetical protein CXG81DRAFT_25429 [Caulochytrium protostelioides]|uniref:Uncharacterized protein n=1 Tax=Caulochytrium protostelioides TaxID=1555241 RepID=A0A4V1IUW1_9FUNG|nr:hypothetical protein CXG81DRAFT_25429 [Caulochytrium protostelioides]|eukprot:RKP01939.1 hypothetical protein CXG81DRAFT_25429 [Caulochytrium protostelioides]